MDRMQLLKRYLMSNSGKVSGSIPSQYQEVEWVQSTGTQLLQIEYQVNANMKLDTYIAFDSLSGTYPANSSWGYYQSTSEGPTNCKFYIWQMAENGYFTFNFMDAAQIAEDFSGDHKNTLQHLVLNKDGIDMNDGQQTKSMGTYTPSVAVGSKFALFGYVYPPSGSSKATTQKITHGITKIYTGNTLSVELHPIRQKNGSQGGMYDVINHVAYLDTGFVYGDDIE